MHSNEFTLVLLILLTLVLVVFAMTYVSVRAYNTSWSRGREMGLGILLGFVWLAALSLCSAPVLIFVPLSNPNRVLGIAVIESVALILAVSMGLIMSRTKRPSIDKA